MFRVESYGVVVLLMSMFFLGCGGSDESDVSNVTSDIKNLQDARNALIVISSSIDEPLVKPVLQVSEQNATSRTLSNIASNTFPCLIQGHINIKTDTSNSLFLETITSHNNCEHTLNSMTNGVITEKEYYEDNSSHTTFSEYTTRENNYTKINNYTARLRLPTANTFDSLVYEGSNYFENESENIRYSYSNYHTILVSETNNSSSTINGTLIIHSSKYACINKSYTVSTRSALTQNSGTLIINNTQFEQESNTSYKVTFSDGSSEVLTSPKASELVCN